MHLGAYKCIYVHLNACRCSNRPPSKGARRATFVCTRFILCHEQHCLCISLQHHCSDGPTMHPLRYLMAVCSIGPIHCMASQVIHSYDGFPSEMHHPFALAYTHWMAPQVKCTHPLRSHTPFVIMLCVQWQNNRFHYMMISFMQSQPHTPYAYII